MGNFAIIPARSGSKGLKDKNIIDLCGKHLLGYTVEAAVKSGVFDEVMVSTDSEVYAEVAKVYGANVPFLRSDENAGDRSSSWDAVREVLAKYKEQGREFDMFTLLQPTSPLRDAEDIKAAFEVYNKKGANSVVSVCELDHSLNICNYLPEDNSLVGFIRDESKSLRQQNGKAYRLNGAIYMCDTKAFLEYGTIYKEKSFAYVMSRRNSVDIDCLEDLKYAEFLMGEK